MQQTRISDLAYERLGRLIQSECGIAFPAAKRPMVEVRLTRRARALNLPSLEAYCAYLHSKEGCQKETPHLVDAVTTHKTAFFREPSHFDYLLDHALPDLVRTAQAGLRRPLLVWSAACSTGEEPFTLAMVLSEFAASLHPRPFRFAIEASDISVGTLSTARKAIYKIDDIAAVPKPLREKYLLRSKHPGRDQVRIAPELRHKVTFRQINLMASDYGFPDPPDVIFCRNVMIYFNREVQYQLVLRLARTLRPGGYLIMGHAESLAGFDLPLRQVKPTVHRRMDG
jgi:chemotaxis protein methyltransferase CheR